MGETKLIRREPMEVTIPQLPEDVVANILSRLPVKHLMQFKCVCKPWWSLISGPHFATLQLARSKENTSCHRFLFVTDRLGSMHCEDVDDDLDHVNQLEYPVVMKSIPDFDEMVYYLRIGGFCNGFICVVFANGRIFLWNPTIREAVELANDGDFDPKMYSIFGLGYDVLVDDYKVLRGRCSRQVEYVSVHDFEFLSSKRNAWCRLKEKPEHDYLSKGRPQPGIFLRGALHWPALRPTKIFVILAFDVTEEKLYELVELPDCIEEVNLYYPVLTNSEDSLILFCGDLYCHHLEAWHLKEYGVKSSWIKIFSNKCSIPKFGLWGNLLHYTKSGKIIFDYGRSGFVWYDLKKIHGKQLLHKFISSGFNMLSMSKAWFYRIGIVHVTRRKQEDSC